MRVFLIAFVSLVGAVYLAAVLFPMGEVVSLHTRDEDGREHRSALWIVETPNGSFLRAGDDQAAWLDRLILHPDVTLERDGESANYRAIPVEDPVLLEIVNAAMAEKYGVAETLLRRLRDVKQSVIVRLEAGPKASHHDD